MIVLKCHRRLSPDDVERVQRMWSEAVTCGKPVVLDPDFDVIELAVPVLTGPLVDYLVQMGDA